jgi:hypothetical protein
VRTTLYVMAAVVVLVLVVYGWRARSRNLDWMTEDALFSSAIAAVPRSSKAQFNYAQVS